MSEVAWLRQRSTGDEYRVERDAAGQVTRASKEARQGGPDRLTGPEANLPDDPETIAAINAHSEDYEEIPLEVLHQDKGRDD